MQTLKIERLPCWIVIDEYFFTTVWYNESEARKVQAKWLENEGSKAEIFMVMKEPKEEALVDAVAEALGVDTGTCSEEMFDDAVKAAREVLGEQ